MRNGEFSPSEPAPDYADDLVTGRFRVSRSEEEIAHSTNVPNPVTAEPKNSPQDLQSKRAEAKDPESEKAKYMELDARYLQYDEARGPSDDYRNGGSVKPAFTTFEKSRLENPGRDNPGYHPEEYDGFDESVVRRRPQKNGEVDPRIQRVRLDSGSSLPRVGKRPASLQLDNSSQRSITFDRVLSYQEGSSKGSNNGSMVLQLVLPQNALRGAMSRESGDKSPNISYPIDLPTNEYYTYTPTVNGHGSGVKGRNGEIHIPKSNELNRAYNSSASLYSEASHHPPPSSGGEKSHMFNSFISIIMSCIYAIFLVTLGMVIYTADVLSTNSSLAAIFNLYLVLVGFAYLAYLYIDIRRYVSDAKKHLQATTNYDNEGDTSSVDLNINNVPAPNHGFCFALGRHAGSFYLRVGASVFCFGHLIHSGLLLVYEVVFLTSEEFYECFSPIALIFDVLYPIYSFFQLFFIFKYSNVIINHCKEVARMLIMHTIASSLCFWVWAIVRESTDSLSRHANSADQESGTAEGGAEVAALITSDGSASVALPLTSYQKRGARNLLEFLNGSYLDSECQHTELNKIYEWVSPYLYPFTIEYSILIVGILYIIWNNIGNCKRGGGSSVEGVPCPPMAGPEAGSNIVLHADCAHANRGLFAGLLVLVGSIVSIILFFIVVADEQFVETGTIVNLATELIILIVMTLSALLAYRQIAKLDVNHHPISLLDDILLFIAIPAFFLYAIFSIVPAAQKHDWLKISTILMGVTQVLIQTPLIIDGLRRCSNAKKLRNEKPGRELITFLLICNVALWINETFEIKSTNMKDARYDFYGKVLWTILKHMTVPLTMFYRFHSSVCLADIWKSAYEPGEFSH